MATMHWINAEKSLEQFLDRDLPFPIKPNCNDTLKIVTDILQSYHISIDLVLTQYPDFINNLNNGIYLYFLYQMSKTN